MKQVVKIPFPDFFSFQECLWFLDRSYDDCLHEVYSDSLLKLIRLQEQILLLHIWEEDSTLCVEIQNTNLEDPAPLIDYIQDWLDMSRDLRPFYKLLKADKDLAFLADKYVGFRLITIPDLFEALVWSIIGQQINLTFAYKLKRRLVENFGEYITCEEKKYYLFPSPEVLAQVQIEALRALQFSQRKSEYITGIAQLFSGGKLSHQQLAQLEDEEAMIQSLLKIRGVGEWTANYALMKSFKMMRCIPFGDAGLKKALESLKALPKSASKEEVQKVFAPFKGWEAYLVFYLWRSLS